jgi:glycosyltransferase involved in cell wall biosynthesis
MSTHELVTIGIPFYNNEETLEFAVRSALLQTHSPLEILLLDDGSKDASLAIAQKLAGQDRRIRVITSAQNQGRAIRRNQLTTEAQGTFFAFLDADDLMAPDRIEKQVAFLREQPAVDVVTTGVVSIDGRNQILGKRCFENRDPEIEQVFKNGGNLIHPSIMAKTGWFRRNRYRDDLTLAEDRELFTRTLTSSVYRVLPEALYYYRDALSLTLQKYLSSYRVERSILRDNWRGRIPRSHAASLYVRSLMKSCAIRLVFAMRQQRRLIERRNTPLDAAELAQISMNIARCMETSPA